MDRPTAVLRAYRYRIYPTRAQRAALEAQLGYACDLYNAALEQRRYAWRTGRRISLIDQFRDLTDVRAARDGPPMMSCSAMRDPLRRLDRAFQAFFRRVNADEKPGYPRFRSRRRYDSLIWDDAWAIRAGRLAIQGIGHIKVRWHRQLPAAARVRTVTIRRVNGRWYGCFALLLPARPRLCHDPKPAVGIDLGILTFAALSTGELLSGPGAYRSASHRARVAGRRLSRRVKGSRRRRKAARLLARVHERIRNIRYNHAHQLSRRLISEFGFIALEDLSIQKMSRGAFAKAIYDQGWAQFVKLLGYKAEDAGVQVVRVPPGGTRLACSDCGTRVPKLLSERTHSCPKCGLVIDRDVNAARNILRLGMSRHA